MNITWQLSADGGAVVCVTWAVVGTGAAVTATFSGAGVFPPPS